MSGVFVVVLVTHLFWPTISTQSPLPHPSTVFLAPSTPLSLSGWGIGGVLLDVARVWP